AGMIGGAIVKSLLRKRYEGEVIATRRDLGKLRELEVLGAKITKKLAVHRVISNVTRCNIQVFSISGSLIIGL
ncbi:MAG: hypothetical protein QXJ07_02435, partial [Candidatus Bathyarchaeia archaeon]